MSRPVTPDADPVGTLELEDAALRARIAELEAENERLAARAPTRERPEGGWWRAVLSAICIVLASILVPVSIASSWVRAELVDTDHFVSTFGPLVDDENVQALIVDQVTTAIHSQVDIDGITNDLFDGIATLDLPPRALAAIDLLRVPAAQGVKGMINDTTATLVESEIFSDVWQTTLRTSHRALVIAATGGDDGVVSIDEHGVVGIELGPVIDEVKGHLVDSGVGFAGAIPSIDKTIVLFQSDAIVVVRLVYGVAVTVGWWMPVISVALFIIGIALARRRTTALVGTGVGLALGAGTLAVSLGTGQMIVGMAASEVGVSSAALLAIYDQVIGAMRQTAVVITVIGIVLAILAWTQGSWRGSIAVRRAVGGVNSSIRNMLSEQHVDTGKFGVWMDRQRVLVRIIIAVLAVLWLWLAQPLSVATVFVVVIVALIVWWLCELVRRPDAGGDAAGDAAADAEPVEIDVEEVEVEVEEIEESRL